METPDKIYLWETPIVNGGYDPAWHKNSFNEGDVEYIRKDALIEFVNKELQESADRLDFRANQAYAEVFDKLNKM